MVHGLSILSICLFENCCCLIRTGHKLVSRSFTWVPYDTVLLEVLCTLKYITRCNKHGVKNKVHQVWYRENKLIVTEFVQNVHHWHEHKHASDCSKPCQKCSKTLSQLIDVMNSGLIHTLLNGKPKCQRCGHQTCQTSISSGLCQLDAAGNILRVHVASTTVEATLHVTE